MTSKFLLLFLERDYFFLYYVILTGHNDSYYNVLQKHWNISKKKLKYIRL